jgi:hypothetical protein
MTYIVWATLAALLAYLALRVVQMKRKTMPFVLAYPIFVLILVGGGVAVFLAGSRVALVYGYNGEDTVALAAIFGVTGLCLLPLWWLARRAIG